MKLAVIGSRDCGSYGVERILERLPEDCTEIITGGARGIDELAAQAARLRGIPLVRILPEYRKYGKRAALIRNARIVELADKVLAFWDFSSAGTANAIAACIEQGVPVEIIGLDGE